MSGSVRDASLRLWKGKRCSSKFSRNVISVYVSKERRNTAIIMQKTVTRLPSLISYKYQLKIIKEIYKC